MRDPRTLRRAAVALSDLLPLSAVAASLGACKASVSMWRRAEGRPPRSPGRMADQGWWCPWCGASVPRPGFCRVLCRDEYVAEFETNNGADGGAEEQG